MKNIILIPDSFKGTLTSTEVCTLMKTAILDHMDAHVVTVPVADGGEGSVDAFLSALPGEKRKVEVQNPLGKPMESFYGVVHHGKTAVVEMAACAGLPLLDKGQLNPACTTTYGVGQLIDHALHHGCQRIILALGGSATNDGGAGCAAALGVRFYNDHGQAFIPTGGTLQNIAHIDTSQRSPLLRQASITVMCDIDNPLYGKTGAASIFAPQKGANPTMVADLDAGLRHFAHCLVRDLDQDVANIPGAGAAGGFGAGAVALLGAQLQMGIDTVLEMVQFEKLLKTADLVFTGEGEIDGQSLRGKVVIGVAKEAKKAGVPVIAVVGSIGQGAQGAYDFGVNAIFSINRTAENFETSRFKTKENLIHTTEDIIRLLNATC